MLVLSVKHRTLFEVKLTNFKITRQEIIVVEGNEYCETFRGL